MTSLPSILPTAKSLGRLVLVVCGGLAIASAGLYVLQRNLLYPAGAPMTRPAFEARVGNAFDGKGFLLAPFDAIVFEPQGTAARGTVIWYHGNAGLGADRVSHAPVFTRRGLRIVFAEYPGYAARPGKPSESVIMADAQALYSEVARRYAPLPVTLVGESLGTGVVTQLAAGAPPARLVLLTPYLSIAETAARRFWMVPARYLVKDAFDSERALPAYKGPVGILVSGRDDVVGADQGRALADVSRRRSGAAETVYVEFPEARHSTWQRVIGDADWDRLLGATVH